MSPDTTSDVVHDLASGAPKAERGEVVNNSAGGQAGVGRHKASTRSRSSESRATSTYYLTWNMEAKLVLPINRVGQIDVYQVDHHGLDDANNPVLIHSLVPVISVMNNGGAGTRTRTVDTLRSFPGLQARYHVHKNMGPAEATNNTPDEFIANLGSDPDHVDANYIKLSVDPTGKTYSVSIPGTGHTRTFQTRLKKD